MAELTNNRCPVCGSQDVTFGSLEVEGATIKQYGFCYHCDLAWQDVYSLTRRDLENTLEA